MIPTVLLGTAQIPNGGGELRLTEHDGNFSISLKGVAGELMTSRTHSSEIALADLGCAHLSKAQKTHVLVGGLGMGFTLAAALKIVDATSQVTVAELVPEIVEWNKGTLGDCAGRPLEDPRTEVFLGDVASLFRSAEHSYDAILLDVDNGPEAFTHPDNGDLYSAQSLQTIRASLKPKGVLAVWSSWHDPRFTKRLKQSHFNVSSKMVRAHKGKGSKHTIYIAQK